MVRFRVLLYNIYRDRGICGGVRPRAVLITRQILCLPYIIYIIQLSLVHHHHHRGRRHRSITNSSSHLPPFVPSTLVHDPDNIRSKRRQLATSRYRAISIIIRPTSRLYTHLTALVKMMYACISYNIM